MKDNRPVNLDIGTIRLPITAFVSITHRATGVILVVASFLLLWALDMSLAGPQSFAALAGALDNVLVKIVLWGICVALIYHSLAGVKHLIMDFGIGETMEGGVLLARMVIVLTVIGAALAGVAVMVTAVTSLSRSGLSDWLVQRVTAVILLAFFGFIAVKIAGGVTYVEWAGLFEQTWMKVFALLAALSLAAHAWIGMWGVFTDYLTERMMGSKGNVLRIGLQLITSLSLVIYVIWAIQIIWS